MKGITDYILPEDQKRYEEIITNAAERKMNAPRKPAERKPLSEEAKIARDEKRLAMLIEKLNKARATQNA